MSTLPYRRQRSSIVSSVGPRRSSRRRTQHGRGFHHSRGLMDERVHGSAGRARLPSGGCAVALPRGASASRGLPRQDLHGEVRPACAVPDAPSVPSRVSLSSPAPPDTARLFRSFGGAFSRVSLRPAQRATARALRQHPSSLARDPPCPPLKPPRVKPATLSQRATTCEHCDHRDYPSGRLWN